MKLRLSLKKTGPNGPPAHTGKVWARCLGAFAFLFFLAKGLVWLAAPAAIIAWSASSGESRSAEKEQPQTAPEESTDAHDD